MRVRGGPATVIGERSPGARNSGRRARLPGARTPRRNLVILLLSTSDTDLLSARSADAEFRLANPSRLDVAELPGLLEGVRIVVVRILGTPRTWQDGLDTLLASGAHVVVLGGEQTPDAELMKLSTVPAGIAAEAHAYLAQGGPANLTQLHAFLSDTVLLTGDGFEPPAASARMGRPGAAFARRRPGRRDPVLPGPPPVREYRIRRTRSPTRSTRRAGARCRSTAASLRTRAPEMMAELGTGRRPAGHRARGGRHAAGRGRRRRRRRGVGRRRDGRARRPDPAGALPDQRPRGVGGQRRRPLAARRRQPDGRPGVRRPAHHGAVLVQGDSTRTASPATCRRRARVPRRRHRAGARPAAAHARRRSGGSR